MRALDDDLKARIGRAAEEASHRPRLTTCEQVVGAARAAGAGRGASTSPHRRRRGAAVFGGKLPEEERGRATCRSASRRACAI